MTDFKELIKFPDAFADFLRKLDMRNAGGQYLTIKQLRIRYWYECLRMEAALEKASELQAKFEPDAIYRDDRGVILGTKNKWSAYRRGERKPHPALLKKVERIAPGSTRAMDHPLWSALDMTDGKILEGDAFLRTLTPEIQRLVLQPADQIIASADRLPLSNRRVAQILRRTNLDTLACLIWLLRKAHASNSGDVQLIFDGLHKTLILLGMKLHSLDIAFPLVKRIIDDILPLGTPSHLKQGMTPEDYLASSFVVDVIAYQNLEKSQQPHNWKSHINFMLELLNGKRGWDLKIAMRPKFILEKGFESIPTEVIDSFQSADALRSDAWNYLLHGSSNFHWNWKAS
jgi:hypothetical protein